MSQLINKCHYCGGTATGGFADVPESNTCHDCYLTYILGCSVNDIRTTLAVTSSQTAVQRALDYERVTNKRVTVERMLQGKLKRMKGNP